MEDLQCVPSKISIKRGTPHKTEAPILEGPGPREHRTSRVGGGPSGVEPSSMALVGKPVKSEMDSVCFSGNETAN